MAGMNAWLVHDDIAEEFAKVRKCRYQSTCIAKKILQGEHIPVLVALYQLDII